MIVTRLLLINLLFAGKDPATVYEIGPSKNYDEVLKCIHCQDSCLMGLRRVGWAVDRYRRGLLPAGGGGEDKPRYLYTPFDALRYQTQYQLH